MILTGPEIIRQVELGRIHIDPFDPEHAGPNSYDLEIGNELLTYAHPCATLESGEKTGWVLDNPLNPKFKNETHQFEIPEQGFILNPGTLYLANTVEEAGSDFYVPMLEGRSSYGRLGLKVHVTAGFGDVGFKRQWTLELEVTHRLRIYAGMRVCQIYFHTIEGEKSLYADKKGKYKDSIGPVASQSWKDFSNES